jgi:hypothetical protein
MHLFFSLAVDYRLIISVGQLMMGFQSDFFGSKSWLEFFFFVSAIT